MSCMFYFDAVLWCPPCRARMRDSHCRVLQYVHGLLIVSVAGVTAASTRISGLLRMGIKRTRCFNAMVGFYLNDL